MRRHAAITNLVLDEESRRTIQELRDRERLSQWLAASMGMGVLATILSTTRPLELAYNISTADLVGFANAVSAIPNIYRHRVETVAGLQYLRVRDHAQQQFWRAVREGCKP